MATTQRIPLIPAIADQLLTVELDGDPFQLRVLWNERGGYFSLSISEVDETPILANVKMVKNYSLIDRFKDTRLPDGKLFFVQDVGNKPRPELADLGVNCFLYFHKPDTEAGTDIVRTGVTSTTLGTFWDVSNGVQLTSWDSGTTNWDL